jgi:hypothetical protein
MTARLRATPAGRATVPKHHGVTQEEPTPTQTPHGHIISNLPLTPGTRLGVY